jgi:predicted peroxiredoxin
MLMNDTKTVAAILCFALLVSAGCNGGTPAKTTGLSASTNSQAEKIALISITSDPKTDPQSVNMGLTFAGFCVDEGYEVAIFFNVKGTTLPTTAFPDDFKYQNHEAMKPQLLALKDRGVELHVCPVCMKDLGIPESDVIEAAFVTSKPKLFANLGPNTMVFTY